MDMKDKAYGEGAGCAPRPEKVRVRVTDAAREIGCAPQFLRLRMQAGDWDLGSYVGPGTGGRHGNYYVFRDKLDKFLGKA